jgi:hypothetical protein
MRLYCLMAWLKYQMAAGASPLPFWVMGCLSLFIPAATTVIFSAVSVHAAHIISCYPATSDDVILSLIHRLRASRTIAAFALVQKCRIYLLLLFASSMSYICILIVGMMLLPLLWMRVICLSNFYVLVLPICWVR